MTPGATVLPVAARADLGRTLSVALVGLEGHVVEVEAHLAASIPGLTIVGLPDASLGEARDRVRAAVQSTGVGLPQRRITVNLAPASLPKSGAGFDLAVAVAVLAGARLVPVAAVRDVVHLGELGLDGRLHGVRGVLPAVLAAARAGVRQVVVPAANRAEAELVSGVRVLGVASLAELLARHGVDITVPEPDPSVRVATPRTPADDDLGDLRDVLGQSEARHALEIAAAGNHHLLMVGPPGAGKTMLARRLPGILPDLTPDQQVEVTSVHSLAGRFDPSTGLIVRPPFESPHHTATAAAIVGGGSGVPRPGAVSLAHRGVLFLDEAPELGTRVLQTLRQPLEQGELVIHRAAGAARYPARFQLVLAANPCPCGAAAASGVGCSCTPMAQRRYFGRLSGPLLDRVDVHCGVRAVGRADLMTATGEPSAVVAARVLEARRAASARLHGTGWTVNAEVPGTWIRERLRSVPGLFTDVERAVEHGALTMRGADRVLRVAWTVADLAGRERPTREDVALATSVRSRGASS